MFTFYRTSALVHQQAHSPIVIVAIELDRLVAGPHFLRWAPQNITGRFPAVNAAHQ
ncbi:hypothetical protein BJY16_005869 [Actinoplanes octamycinicus]|uniref:Uncharacterized protein n=1 Tax=Actinoplanes octamycinicus TaxID=135948 RepID=A0A7W7MA24_9ACTN|nr:hypothetical protein [Actinoplanes octamycinicus]MBB4742410.1 hypothetical protein [Actinoplanes octamycinicus]